MAKDAVSFIGEGAEFVGKFNATGQIRINGKFDGELKTEGLIQVGPTGKVKTNIVGRRVIIEGTLLGNINASEDVTITETGRVMGDITTPNLQLGKGVVVNGKINITGGQPKQAKQLFGEVFTGKESRSAKDIPGGTEDGPVKKSRKK